MRHLASILLFISWMSCCFNCSTEQFVAGVPLCGAGQHDCQGQEDAPEGDSSTCSDNLIVVPESVKVPPADNAGETINETEQFLVGLLWDMAIQEWSGRPWEIVRNHQTDFALPTNSSVHIARPIRGPSA